MTKPKESRSMSRRSFIALAGGTAGIATIGATGVPMSWALNTPKVGETSQQDRAGTPANQEGMAVNPYPVNPSRISSKDYEHKGDFTVMTVGTGCPDTIVGRSGPSTLVQYKGNYFLVDILSGRCNHHITCKICSTYGGMGLSMLTSVLTIVFFCFPFTN